MSSVHRLATTDIIGLPRNRRGVVGSQIQSELGNFFGLDEALYGNGRDRVVAKDFR